MEVLSQTSHKLIVGTTKSALRNVRRQALVISVPACLIFLFFLLGGGLDYLALNCHRDRPIEKQCHFVRISLVRPFYRQFSAKSLTSAHLQQVGNNRNNKNAPYTRLIITVESQGLRLPLTSSYDGPRQQQQLSRVQTFIEDVTVSTLIIRVWPAFFFFLVCIIPLAPVTLVSLLMLVTPASPTAISLNKLSRQIRISGEGSFAEDDRAYQFEEIHILVKTRSIRSRFDRPPIEHYELLIVTESDKKLFQFYYTKRSEADRIAQVMQQFILDA